jgi:hypothetical protein
MTIYGTIGGTTLNITPFQGTQPGNAVQATLQPVNPGVGLFPPNSNNASGDTVLASASRAALPLNLQGSGYGATSQSGAGTGNGGRTVAEALSIGERNGTGIQTGIADSMNSDANGGQSLGAGGSNQTEGPTSGTGSQASAQQPMNTFTQPSAVTVYGG